MAIYFIAAPSVGLIKIGYAADVVRRFRAINASSPVPVEMVGVMAGGIEDEIRLHLRFEALRRRGEWFDDVPEVRALASPFVIPSANRKKHSVNALGNWLKIKGQLPAHFAREIGLDQTQVRRACIGGKMSDRVWNKIAAATNGEITRASIEVAA